jgi:hypothetical protein
MLLSILTLIGIGVILTIFFWPRLCQDQQLKKGLRVLIEEAEATRPAGLEGLPAEVIQSYRK